MLVAGVLLRPVADGAEDWGFYGGGEGDWVEVEVVVVEDSIVHTIKQIDVCHSLSHSLASCYVTCYVISICSWSLSCDMDAPALHV